MLYACGKQYCMYVACIMHWCSNTIMNHDISAPLPLLVSNLNIHDIIVVHTSYILECTPLTIIPVLYRYVQSTHRYSDIPECTSWHQSFQLTGHPGAACHAQTATATGSPHTHCCHASHPLLQCHSCPPVSQTSCAVVEW